MKTTIRALAAAAMLLTAGASGCCFGDPEQGQFCFIVIPIFGTESVDPGSGAVVAPIDCALLR